MKIYIVRHGQTNKNIYFTTKHDDQSEPLNTVGLEQSDITGKYLHDYRINSEPFDMIFCSPYLRCRQTAQIIAKNINFDEDKIQYMDELKEINQQGDIFNVDPKELDTNSYYNQYNFMMKKLYSYEDPIKIAHQIIHVSTWAKKIEKKYHIETINDARKRIKTGLDKILTTDFKKILIITHGGSMLNMLSLIANIEDALWGDVSNGSNCAISYIQYTNGKTIVKTLPNTLHYSIYGKKYEKKPISDNPEI